MSDNLQEEVGSYYPIKKGEHLGYEYFIVKGPFESYHYLGYVKLQDDSKFEDYDKDDIPVEVHGGITFKGNPFDDEPEEWIGFDTLHFGDGDWITENYVEMNCRYMIEQLYRLEREGE